MRKKTVEGRVGAYLVDGEEDINYYLVRWVGQPYQAERDMEIDNGTIPFQVRRGEWLCEGKWLFHIPDAPNWYYVKEKEDTVVVRMQQVVSADVRMIPVGPGHKLPETCGDASRRTYMEKKYKPMKILPSDHDFLMDRASEMEDWDHYEVTPDDDPDGYGDDPDGYEDEEGEEGGEEGGDGGDSEDGEGE